VDLGAVVIGSAFNALTWQVVANAALSLTVIRMLPVFPARFGSELKEPLFIG
jgi:hypothetical protein